MNVLRFVAKRLFAGFMLLVVLSVATFLMVRLLPGSVEDVLLGTESASPEAVIAIQERYGLNESLPVQYGTWASGILQGDFGESPRTRRPVGPDLLDKAWTSLQLGVLSVVVAVVVGVVVGTVAGLRRGSTWDTAGTATSLLGSSVPDFVIGLLLIMVLARNVPFIPTSGFAPISSGVWDWLRHLILPVTSLSLILIGVLVRLTRSAVAETADLEFVRTARGKGLPPSWVVLRHIVRPSLTSVTATVGVQLVAVLGGVVVVEVVFSIPGLGRLVLDAIRTRDYVTAQGATLLIGVWAVFVGVAMDFIHGMLNPRARLGA